MVDTNRWSKAQNYLLHAVSQQDGALFYITCAVCSLKENISEFIGLEDIQ